MKRIEKWARCKALTKLRSQEKAHQVDNQKEIKRNITGQMGELAVEKYLGIQFVDWSVGNSEKYNVPDIGIKNVGVKTVEYGKMPVVLKNPGYPEIICVRKENTVYIAGLATPEILMKYQDDNLILDENLRKRNVKTGFYGFSELKPIDEFTKKVA